MSRSDRGGDTAKPRKPNIPLAVRSLIAQYRSFLRTSYRFLDPHLRQQFEDHLSGADVVVKGPFVTLARDFRRGRTLRQLVEAGEAAPELLRARWAFGAEPLFVHQERAFAIGRAGRPCVVTTGTGSGKTEAFLLPALDGILRQRREGVQGVQAILLYPMNALANDQLERMRRLLRGAGLPVSFGLYTGDSETSSVSLNEEPAENERILRADIRRSPPDILLTNYKQLEFLLVRRDDRHLFTPALRYLVLDEVHSYRGALATEIACLIRRLKARAGKSEGGLVTIGTSATVAGGPDSIEGLAGFATTLFGERVTPEDVVGEELMPPPVAEQAWVPRSPRLADSDLKTLDPSDDSAVVSLAERLTGRRCPEAGPIATRVGRVFEGNAIVGVLEDACTSPRGVTQLVQLVQQQVPERTDALDVDLRREIEAYLLVGSIGDEANPPRLRPKLHVMFHGVYDVWLCLNPACRSLVPQGGAQCPACRSAARPAALCRTCGQDFVKVRFEGDGGRTVGTGDFFSDKSTGYLTWKLHDLTDGGEEDESETEDGEEAKPPQRRAAEERLEEVATCLSCGRVLDSGTGSCPECGTATSRMLLYRGKLNRCPSCGDINTRIDIVAPLRTGTASTVSVLATHHLEHLDGSDRKLLIFADGRQDAAHQAGYTADKHRVFALRHLINSAVAEAGSAGIALDDTPQRLFDEYRRLGIIEHRPTRSEQEKWLFALRYLAVNELTRSARQRISLEHLGLVGVEYEFLDELLEDARFVRLAEGVGLDPPVALALVRAMLDVMRHQRAVDHDFFLEYLDPNKKRRYRELEEDPFQVRWPERDRAPKAFALHRTDAMRKSGRLMGFYQEAAKGGQPTAVEKLASRLIGERARARAFIDAVVELLQEEAHPILVRVPQFSIPTKERTSQVHPVQISRRVIRLIGGVRGFRCSSCQTWRPYALPTCPKPRCGDGRFGAAPANDDNYYVGLYRTRPRPLRIAEHSAQVPAEERAKREAALKSDRIEALACTPTLELGVDIGPLLTVVLRNAPPTPANYAQRVGRAGRRLRIGFASTSCAGGSHDRHAFEDPEWLIAGHFDPPPIRLDNPKVVHRHLRAHVLEKLEAQLPGLMGSFVDDLKHPTRWKPELVQGLVDEIESRQDELADAAGRLLEADRKAGRTALLDDEQAREIVADFPKRLVAVVDGWWERIVQLDREYREYATVGSPRADERKASARKRAYHELTQDRERAYTLSYLAMRGLLPAYQFPVDTFSLDPGVDDTQTLHRSAAIAIDEFAPGNYVYANGHKLRSIRVLFPGGPGQHGGLGGRTDAETSGRLQSIHFCETCQEAVEEVRNSCPSCAGPLRDPEEVVFVEAFEAEENLRIGSDEESRERTPQDIRENLLGSTDGRASVYSYHLLPVESVRLGRLLLTNWGRPPSKRSAGQRFWLCPDCGRHRPHEPTDERAKAWDERHRRSCTAKLSPMILGYRFEADCLVLWLPTFDEAPADAPRRASPTAVTLAQALVLGANELLELEQGELRAFARRRVAGRVGEQLVFYETVPGGAGYAEEMAARLPEVARAALERLFGHQCRRACYLCLKHYYNQRDHDVLNKDAVRSLLWELAQQPAVVPIGGALGSGHESLRRMVDEHQVSQEASRDRPDARKRRRLRGYIEEPLAAALARVPSLPPPNRDLEIERDGRLYAVPDFTWEDARLAVYCDSFAFHAHEDALVLDADKRNGLQSKGWMVMTFWSPTILRDPDACALEISAAHVERLRRR